MFDVNVFNVKNASLQMSTNLHFQLNPPDPPELVHAKFQPLFATLDNLSIYFWVKLIKVIRQLFGFQIGRKRRDTLESIF